MQNVYKSSPRIKIRWLSELKSSADVYELDFYDVTDLECVLTTLDLGRADKNNYRLPQKERERIENILRKAIDVEKGLLPRPEVTEENPDGCKLNNFLFLTCLFCNIFLCFFLVDLSLYTNEAQLNKEIDKSKGAFTPAKGKSVDASSNKFSAKKKRATTHCTSTKNLNETKNDDFDYTPTTKKRSMAISTTYSAPAATTSIAKHV